MQNNSAAAAMQMSYNGVSYTMPTTGGVGVPVQGIEAIITTVMDKTGRFRLLERSVIDQALREQDLAAEGRITKESSARTGKVLGAEFLIQAVVTNYESGIESQNIGAIAGFIPIPGAALLGGLSSKKSKGVVGMNFRVINPETSEILFTHQVEVAMEESSMGFGGIGLGGSGGLGGFLSDYSKTPIGQAVIAAVNKGVYEVIKEMGTSPAQGTVVKADGADSVYLNLGTGSVSEGERLKVSDPGEQIIDPETGLSLGGEERHIADVTVTSVKEKYSIAKLDQSFRKAKLKRGNRVVSYTVPPANEFAPTWTAPASASGKSGLFGTGNGVTANPSAQGGTTGFGF
ncbi:MAG: hypothetical protein H6981_13515 [Gammaproteobacteria bacterium]|nr:hypothetical protein [Gammaproteobacteria bacterium]MCP5137808.1 hypothetical protein [Gammaproteobacteria bacterium]